jgi:O-antigen/teichoic acid export membrane protein
MALFPQRRAADYWFGKHQHGSMAKAGFWAGINSGSLAALQLTGAVILGRLLPPETFGLMTVILFFQALLGQFNSMGFVTTLIQKEDLVAEQASGVFWLNVGVGAGLCVLMFVIGPFVAVFYKAPVLEPISRCMGCLLLLGSCTAQHMGLLERQLDYQSITLIQFISHSGSVCVAVLMAWKGFGVWALVGQLIAGSLLSLCLLYWTVAWRPGRFARGVGLRRMLAYGLRATMGNLVNFMTKYSQAVVLARVVSPVEAGYYNRGQALFQNPFGRIQGPIGSVLFPSLSNLQNQPKQFQAMLFQANALLAFVLLPVLAIFICGGDRLLVLLLGAQWISSGQVAVWLAVAASPSVIGGVLAQANAARGRPARGLWFSLVCLPFLLGGVYWVAPGGAVAVAQFLAGFGWLKFVPDQAIQLRGIGIHVSQHLRACLMRLLQLGVLLLLGFAWRACLWSDQLLFQLASMLALATVVMVGLLGMYACNREGRAVLSVLQQKLVAVYAGLLAFKKGTV